VWGGGGGVCVKAIPSTVAAVKKKFSRTFRILGSSSFHYRMGPFK